VCGQVYSQSLYLQGKLLGYSLNRKLDEPHSQPGCFGEDKGVFCLLEIEPQFLGVVTILATLGNVAWVEETKIT
jgi:hypothetical protein